MKLPQTGWVFSTELAEAVGCSVQTVGDWIQKYNLPATLIGNSTFIKLEAFYAALETLGAEQLAERMKGDKKASGPTRVRKVRKDCQV